MTDFEKNELKWELEMTVGIILDRYQKSCEELENLIESDLENYSSDKLEDHERKFNDLLRKKTRDSCRLRSFCRAMKIVDEHLNLGLEIPEEGKID